MTACWGWIMQGFLQAPRAAKPPWGQGASTCEKRHAASGHTPRGAAAPAPIAAAPPWRRPCHGRCVGGGATGTITSDRLGASRSESCAATISHQLPAEKNPDRQLALSGAELPVDRAGQKAVVGYFKAIAPDYGPGHRLHRGPSRRLKFDAADLRKIAVQFVPPRLRFQQIRKEESHEQACI